MIEQDTSEDSIADELLIAKLQEQFKSAKIDLHEEFCYAHNCKELPEKMESTPKMKKLREMDTAKRYICGCRKQSMK